MADQPEAAVTRLPVEYTDKQGRRHNAVLRATIVERQPPFGVARGSTATVQKAEAARASAAPEDDPWRRLVGSQASLIDPPYDMEFLALAADNSNELGQNVRSMVTNTVRFGWSLRLHPSLSGLPDLAAKYADEIRAEASWLRTRVQRVHPKDSLVAVRARVKHDKHLMGNGYLELINNSKGDLVGLSHVAGHTIRLTAQDEEPVLVQVPYIDPDADFQIKREPMEARFRRLVHVRGDKLVWFKEAGDPRQLDRDTGSYAKEGEEIPFVKQATALLHHRVYCPGSAYGVPVWIGNLFSFFGSRAAEEINFNTLSNNAIPSMFLIVENGILTSESVDRIREFVEGQIKASPSYSKIIILEGEPIEEGSPNPSAFRIRVEPLKAMQQTDELFQNYDSNNRDKLRQCFRLPPIFVGRSDDYTRATAEASIILADEQVFAPDRDEDDDLFNRFVLLPWGARFHRLRSMHPNITNDVELIQMMGIAERSGGMTPRRADRIVQDVFGDDIGPLPKNVELDEPYSLQFAKAQGGAAAMGGGFGGEDEAQRDPAQRLVANLLRLRKIVNRELASRFDSGD